MTSRIYMLKDSKTGKPFYVGSTTARITERLKGHKRENKSVVALIEAGSEITVHLLQEVDMSESANAENYWMDKLRSEGFVLTNKNKASPCYYMSKKFQDKAEQLKNWATAPTPNAGKRWRHHDPTAA